MGDIRKLPTRVIDVAIAILATGSELNAWNSQFSVELYTLLLEKVAADSRHLAMLETLPNLLSLRVPQGAQHSPVIQISFVGCTQRKECKIREFMTATPVTTA